MITDKLAAFMGTKSQSEKRLEKEHDDLMKKMEKEAKAIATMVKSEGWKMLEKYIDNRVAQTHLQMEKCSPKELHVLQNKIEAYKNAFGFLNSKILQNYEEK